MPISVWTWEKEIIIFFQRLLEEKAKSITGIHQWPFRALARSFEVIPRTLIQNCGANVIRTLTALRSKHAQDGNLTWGVDGDNGNLVDMKQLGIWEPLSVKQQTYKTAMEVFKTAVLLLRIDDIVSGAKKQSALSEKQDSGKQSKKEDDEAMPKEE